MSKATRSIWAELQRDVRRLACDYRPHRIDVEQLLGTVHAERLIDLAAKARDVGPLGHQRLAESLATEAAAATDVHGARAMRLLVRAQRA